MNDETRLHAREGRATVAWRLRASRWARAAVVSALGAGLASCASSPPMRFYTLSAVGGGGGSANANANANATTNTGASADPSANANVNASPSSSAPPAIRVARVTLPGEVDRAELVQRIDANRLRLAEEDRWAAPLAEMVRRALTDDLRSRVPAASGEPDALSVDIEEFIGDANCSVSLRAAWTLTRAGASQPATHGYEAIRTDASGACNVGALPEAMSRALAELSSRVAFARSR